MDDYLDQRWKRRHISLRNEKPRGFQGRRGTSFLLSGFLLAFFSSLIFLLGCSNDEFAQQLASLDARLERVEAKLAQMEEQTERMALLEQEVKALQESISELKKPAPAKTAKARYHEVQQGDNLSVIAQQYNMSVQELCRINGITPRTIIRPGEMLLVTPGG